LIHSAQLLLDDLLLVFSLLLGDGALPGKPIGRIRVEGRHGLSVVLGWSYVGLLKQRGRRRMRRRRRVHGDASRRQAKLGTIGCC